MARVPIADEMALVRKLARTLGLGAVTPRLVKAAHHTTLHLAPLGIVARVQSAERVGDALATAARELAVARHLARRRSPAITPLDDGLAGPHVAGGAVVTFWPFVAATRTADDADAATAATALADLHLGLRDYAGPLPSFTRALDRCRDVLDLARTALSGDDRALLAAHYRRLRSTVEATAAAHVPLHGDAHLGNLLIAPDGLRWIDFEDACRGPAEIDIACLPAAAWPRFATADQGLVRRCADLKSVCVAIWCAAEPVRSASVQEAADYHLKQVRALGLPANATTSLASWLNRSET